MAVFVSDPLDYSPVLKAFERKGVSKCWLDRAMESIRSLCVGQNCCSGYSEVRVDSGWPLVGRLTFRRDADGRRFGLRLRGNKWIAKEVS